ncbi:uncharacterized protein LOC107884821 isoform X2 [Acyrthosiphon pisum]|uniref:Uncharacterized protein n=1 Tax=Acyrthosiphon pisum TaxID=7029 RepID=A0A8R2NWY4_ACYPI|nr:uncharacterized protein LOC107884821 isoform X2 [Acyrthosiphon pisum]
MYTNAVKSYNLGLERKEDRDKLLREWDDLGNKEDKKTLKTKYYEKMLYDINKKNDSTVFPTASTFCKETIAKGRK